MSTPTYDEYLADPSALIERVAREARRSRAEALGRLVRELFQ